MTVMRPARRPGKKPRTVDRVALLAMELTNKGHAVPTDVLLETLQENSLTVVGREVAVISPPSASDAQLGELPARPAPSAPPGLTSDSDCLEEEDPETSSQEEDLEVVQLLLPAPWLPSGTRQVSYGKDAAGRDLWSYHLSCAEPGCRVAAMTHVDYGSTPVDEATMAGWTKLTHGWRGPSCPAHGGRRR